MRPCISKSAVPDGKALLFARTQLGHHVSLLIGFNRFLSVLISLANEGSEVKEGFRGVRGSDLIS